MSNEYSYGEDDLAGVGGGVTHPVGDYTTVIKKAESKKDKNGRPNLALVLEVTHGSQKGETFYENYLPLGRESKGKRAGLPNIRTASFLKAVGHKSGIPAGAPGGADAGVYVGTIVQVHNDNEYQDVPGEQYPVRTWETKFKELKAAGKLDNIKPRDALGFYSMDDDFEGLGSGGGVSNTTASAAPADDEEWG